MSELRLGAVVRMKKPHPCGGAKWEIVRVGADYKVKCLTCGRVVMLTADELLRRALRTEESGS